MRDVAAYSHQENTAPCKSIASDDFTTLIAQMRVREEGKDWQRIVLRDVESRLGDDPDFPCIFSKNAFRKKLLVFIFVDDIDAGGMRHLAAGLSEYIEISRKWDGILSTAYPLVVAFSHEAIKAQSVADYDAFGWKVLQKLHEMDPAPWPENVGKDPNLPSCSMCFNSMPIFCNCLGVCNVFMACEPLAGRRMTQVTERKTKIDWAHFLQDVAAAYTEAERITLVMDNLNTHTPASLYEAFEPVQAKALWDRFEFVYTPKHGSWLNMAEIELNVMIGPCLNRRLDCIDKVRHEVAAWQSQRDQLNAQVNWQFTCADARVKLKRLYPTFDV